MSAALIAPLAVASAPERPDARRLIEQVIANQEAKQQLQRQYAYRETTTTEFLGKDGSVDKAKSEAFQVTPSPDGEYRRLVAKDGQPLPPEMEKKEEEKFQKYLNKQLKRSAEERERNTEEKLTSRVSRFQTRLRDALEVYEFTRAPRREDTRYPHTLLRILPAVRLQATLQRHQGSQSARGDGVDRSEANTDRQDSHHFSRGHETLLRPVRKGIQRLGSDR